MKPYTKEGVMENKSFNVFNLTEEQFRYICYLENEIEEKEIEIKNLKEAEKK